MEVRSPSLGNLAFFANGPRRGGRKEIIMATNHAQAREQFAIVTRALAGVCHKCEICSYADRKRGSALGRLMRWHRTWCPAWAAHTRVYSRKPLSE